MNVFGSYLCRYPAHFEANRSNAVDGYSDDIDNDLYKCHPPGEERSATNTVMSEGQDSETNCSFKGIYLFFILIFNFVIFFYYFFTYSFFLNLFSNFF